MHLDVFQRHKRFNVRNFVGQLPARQYLTFGGFKTLKIFNGIYGLNEDLEDKVLAWQHDAKKRDTRNTFFELDHSVRPERVHYAVRRFVRCAYIHISTIKTSKLKIKEIKDKLSKDAEKTKDPIEKDLKKLEDMVKEMEKRLKTKL